MPDKRSIWNAIKKAADDFEERAGKKIAFRMAGEGNQVRGDYQSDDPEENVGQESRDHNDRRTDPEWDSDPDPDFDDYPIKKKPELSSGMSKSTKIKRIADAIRPPLNGGNKLSGIGLGILGLGFLTFFTAGDPMYNEETGYHDIENDGRAERSVGFSIMGLGVLLMVTGMVIGARSDRKLEDTIGFMLNMREQFPEIPVDFDIKKLKRLEAVLPAIIANLEQSDREVLDALLKDDAKRLLENDKLRELVSNMFADHLKKHPRDLDRIMDAYRGVLTWDMAKQYTTPHREY